MFIAYTKTGHIYLEKNEAGADNFTWEDIPKDTIITAMALTFPVATGGKGILPKVTINKYHYYYFFNEATISVVRSSTGGVNQTSGSLVAKVMAGVDVEKKYVIEVRVDKFGNTSINKYDVAALIKKLETGQMRKSILRQGADCAPDKKLI